MAGYLAAAAMWWVWHLRRTGYAAPGGELDLVAAAARAPSARATLLGPAGEASCHALTSAAMSLALLVSI